jgi:hypothetical protein
MMPPGATCRASIPGQADGQTASLVRAFLVGLCGSPLGAVPSLTGIDRRSKNPLVDSWEMGLVNSQEIYRFNPGGARKSAKLVKRKALTEPSFLRKTPEIAGRQKARRLFF